MEITKNGKRIQSIWKFAKKYVVLFLIAELCILSLYGVSLFLPLNLTRLTDQVLFGKQYGLLPQVILNYLLLFLIAVFFNFIYAFTWQTLNNRYIVDIKNAVFRKIIYAKAKWLSQINSGDLMSRIDVDSDQFIHAVQRNLFHFVNSIVLCAAIIFMVARIHPVIAFMLVAAALLPIIATKLCGRLTEAYTKKNREINGKLTGRLFEILKGFRDIKLLCCEHWATGQLLDPLKRIIALSNRIRGVDFAVGQGISLMNLLITLIIYGYSAYQIVNQHMTLGSFLAIIEYMSLLHMKFNWMLRIYLDWFGRKVSIDRVNEILETEQEDTNGGPLDPVTQITFQNVTFGYHDTPVLKDVSFVLEKGDRLAIVGASGVGKTTITGLLTKLYAPDSGSILFNRQSISEISTACLRKQIGIVSQEILLFDESIRYNLSFGVPYSDYELITVLKNVELWDTIKFLPQGLDSKISAVANGLSGGQKQRLMIARLLLKKASVFILDEATSALDVITEKTIINRLADLNPDTIMIMISHRYAAIQNCNKVLIVENGTVEKVDEHQNAKQNSKTYIRLFGEKVGAAK